MTETTTLETTDFDWLETRVSTLIEDEGPIDPTESLIYYGLDSLRVMKLAGELKERGITVSFEELATDPTLNAWSALIDARKTN